MIISSFVQPIESSPEFKVWIKPLSFALVSKVKESMAKKKGEGPDQEVDVIEDLAKPILLGYVDRVEGLEINGLHIQTAEQFFEHCPSEYAQKVVDFVLKSISPSEEEKKS